MRNLTIFVLIAITLGVPFVMLSPQRGAAANGGGRGSVDLADVQLYQVNRENVTRHVEAVGEIEANETVQLVFEADGRIEEVYVQEGDYVLAGSVIARLENNTEQLLYQQAALQLNQAELEMYDLQTVEDDEIRVAEAQLQSAWIAMGNANNSINDLDIAALEEQAALGREQAAYLLEQRNQAPGGYNGQAYARLDQQAGAASFQAEIAARQADLLREQRVPAQNAAYAQVLNAQSQLEVLLAGPTDAQIQQAQIEIDQSTANVARAEADYNDTFLVAPFDGVVSRMDIETGSVVVANGGIMEMTDISPLTLTIEVDEVDIGLVETGMPVTVELDALPGVELTAVIDEIAPRGEDNSGIVTYDVDVSLDDENSMVRVGMTADTTIIIDQTENALSVPNAYISRDVETGQPFLLVLREDGTLEEVSVSLGLAGTDNTVVLDGLDEGDLIAIERSGSGGFLGG